MLLMSCFQKSTQYNTYCGHNCCKNKTKQKQKQKQNQTNKQKQNKNKKQTNKQTKKKQKKNLATPQNTQFERMRFATTEIDVQDFKALDIISINFSCITLS